MKRRFLVICIPLILLIAAASFFYSVILPLYAHLNIVSISHDYQPQVLESFDKKYALETVKTETGSGVYATFNIRFRGQHEFVFQCTDQYRTMDLKSINWDSDSYDIIVDSGDVGTIIYQFYEGKWTKQ